MVRFKTWTLDQSPSSEADNDLIGDKILKLLCDSTLWTLIVLYIQRSPQTRRFPGCENNSNNIHRTEFLCETASKKHAFVNFVPVYGLK